MMYAKITPAIVEVSDRTSLLTAWKTFGGSATICRFVMAGELSESQRRRLPAGLRELLVVKNKRRN
jgi:hypothetical protein